MAEELCRYFNNEVNVDPKEFYRNGELRDRIKNGIGMNLDFIKRYGIRLKIQVLFSKYYFCSIAWNTQNFQIEM